MNCSLIVPQDHCIAKWARRRLPSVSPVGATSLPLASRQPVCQLRSERHQLLAKFNLRLSSPYDTIFKNITKPQRANTISPVCMFYNLPCASRTLFILMLYWYVLLYKIMSFPVTFSYLHITSILSPFLPLPTCSGPSLFPDSLLQPLFHESFKQIPHSAVVFLTLAHFM